MELLSFEAILIVGLLLIYISASHIIEVKKFIYLHESAVAIVMGLLAAIIIGWSSKTTVKFNDEIFFNFILPPIIFSAGYNLRKKDFFENFGYIMFFGMVGTILTFTIIASFAAFFNEFPYIMPEKLKISDILMLACILSATDTVAALSLVKETRYPKLNSILFGEGIMNDAVSILIFRSVRNFLVKENSEQFGLKTVLVLGLEFVYLLVMSVFIGIFFGLAITFLFKKFTSFQRFPIRETSFMILIAYLSYQTAEALNLSGIISLFVCGIAMAHYTFHNLSEESQKGTVLAFDTVGYLAEALVFAYLGLTVFWIETKEFYTLFIVLMTVVLAFARCFSIFLLPCILFLCKRDLKLQAKELKIIWYSGLIRGAIAFALSFHADTPGKKTIVATTISIVLITTFILSTLLQSFAVYIGLNNSDDSNNLFGDFQKFVINNRESEELSGYKEIGSYPTLNKKREEEIQRDEEKIQKQKEFVREKELEKMNFLQKKWIKFDENVMKPFFVGSSNNEAGLLTKKKQPEMIEFSSKTFKK